MLLGHDYTLQTEVRYKEDLGQEHEIDYRRFRYSRYASPCVLFILACALTLLTLSLWQGNIADGAGLKDGIPRDLEPWADAENGDGGVPRINRGFRLAAAVISIGTAMSVGLVFNANPAPRVQRIAYIGAGVLYLLAFVMAVTAFALDVGDTGEAERCTTDPFSLTKTCEAQRGYILALVALDVMVAAFALLTGALSLLWGWDRSFRRGYSHWADVARSEQEAALEAAEDHRPGLRWVHTTFCLCCTAALFLAAAALLSVTILLHELRERVAGDAWDTTSSTPQLYAGWPASHTQARLWSASFASVMCVLYLFSGDRREAAYLVGVGFLAAAGVLFMCVAIDADSVDNARARVCPPLVTCTYGAYVATTVVGYIGGLAAGVFVVREFLIRRFKTRVYVPKAPPVVDTSSVPPGIYDDPDNPPPSPPPPQPWLGMDVVEVHHLETDELCVNVARVTPKSAAATAGVLVDDTLYSCNGDAILSKADFARLVGQQRPGREMALEVLRTEYIKNIDFPDEGDFTRTSVKMLMLVPNMVPGR